jgi:hypothetical protein
MKTLLKLSLAAVLTAAMSFGAALYPIQASRSYTAAGNVGCTISGATNATPIVVTCSAAHNFVDGDQFRITGVGGNTNANTVGYVKVTGYSTTTFGLYSDAALSSGIAGNASYTSGGVATQNYLVSGVTGDWTLDFVLESLTNGKNVLVSIEESADGFSSDIRQLAVFSYAGVTGSGQIKQSVRKYQLPMARLGTANVALRVKVQAIDSSGTAVVSAYVEY